MERFLENGGRRTEMVDVSGSLYPKHQYDIIFVKILLFLWTEFD